MKGNIIASIKYKQDPLLLIYMFITAAKLGVCLLLIIRFLRCLVLGILSLGLISNVSAESNYSAKFQLPAIKKYNIDDGLSQATVYDIAQDNNGYIWLATQSVIDMSLIHLRRSRPST